MLVIIVVTAMLAYLSCKIADPALLLFRTIGMLQAGCIPPGAPDGPAAVVPNIICRPAHQHAFNLSVSDV